MPRHSFYRIVLSPLVAVAPGCGRPRTITAAKVKRVVTATTQTTRDRRTSAPQQDRQLVTVSGFVPYGELHACDCRR
jgi:hypothetical protein